jgi:hypothetical protein
VRGPQYNNPNLGVTGERNRPDPEPERIRVYPNAEEPTSATEQEHDDN